MTTQRAMTVKIFTDWVKILVGVVGICTFVWGVFTVVWKAGAYKEQIVGKIEKYDACVDTVASLRRNFYEANRLHNMVTESIISSMSVEEQSQVSRNYAIISNNYSQRNGY